MEDTLVQHRKKASDLSLGSSHEKIYQKAIDLLKSFAGSGSHLEFGSGQGSLVRRIQGLGQFSQISAVDLMEKPTDVSQVDWRACDLNADLPFDDGVFNSISALEIIEHLENPRHVFRELFRVLAPSGHLVMSTPNNESLRALLSFWRRGHFVAFTDRDYPAHITALNRKDLLRASKEAGFQFVAFDYSGLGALPGLTRWSWQGLSFGALKGLRFSDNIFIVLQKNN